MLQLTFHSLNYNIKSVIMMGCSVNVHTIAILFYLCLKSYRFLGNREQAIVNGQKLRSLFLLFELLQPMGELLYINRLH